MPNVKFIESDKNLGLVAIDVQRYNSMTQEHLRDSETYIKIGPVTDHQDIIMRNIQNQLDEIIGSILHLPPHQVKYLKYPWKYKLPCFHVLPKLHKPNDTKGRPIVGATAWMTTPASKLLDRLLSERPKPAHILKNSLELLKRIKNISLNEKSYLVTMDIQSLYTNIDIPNLENLIDSHDSTCGDLCKYINKNNYFTYKNDLYFQKQGLPMGTNAAVSLANIYLEHYLDPILLRNPKISFYHRYIDDLFFIYTPTSNMEEFNHLETMLNSAIPKIKLTSITNQNIINFLDLTIFKEDNKIQTRVYYKPMNRFLYLPYQSCHPVSVKKSFISGEILRYKRLNTTVFNYNIQKEIFRTYLLQRGYPKRFLDPIFKTEPMDPKATDTVQYKQMITRHDGTNINPIKALFHQQKDSCNHLGVTIRLTFRNSPSIAKLLMTSNLNERQMKYLEDLITSTSPPTNSYLSHTTDL